MTAGRLSPRQVAVLTAASDDVSLAVAAARLGIPRTQVASRLSEAYRALGVDWMPQSDRRAAAVKAARAAGLLGVPEEARLPGRPVSVRERLARLARAEAAVEAVREIHRWVECVNVRCKTGGWCVGCDPGGLGDCAEHPWPCPTVRAVDAAVGLGDASEAPEPRPAAAGASSGDGAAFNRPGSPSSRPEDSRSDPSRPEAGPGGASRGLAASARPSPASSP